MELLHLLSYSWLNYVIRVAGIYQPIGYRIDLMLSSWDSYPSGEHMANGKSLLGWGQNQVSFALL